MGAGPSTGSCGDEKGPERFGVTYTLSHTFVSIPWAPRTLAWLILAKALLEANVDMENISGIRSCIALRSVFPPGSRYVRKP